MSWLGDIYFSETLKNTDRCRQKIGLRGGRKKEKSVWHVVKQVENKLCQDTAHNSSVASLQLSCGLVWEFYWFCFFFFPLSYPLNLTCSVCCIGVLMCQVRTKQRTEEASVFRCINGITEAKMAAGERWVHREYQTDPCCCRSAKPFNCDCLDSPGASVSMCLCTVELGREGKWVRNFMCTFIFFFSRAMLKNCVIFTYFHLFYFCYFFFYPAYACWFRFESLLTKLHPGFSVW